MIENVGSSTVIAMETFKVIRKKELINFLFWDGRIIIYSIFLSIRSHANFSIRIEPYRTWLDLFYFSISPSWTFFISSFFFRSSVKKFYLLKRLPFLVMINQANYELKIKKNLWWVGSIIIIISTQERNVENLFSCVED